MLAAIILGASQQLATSLQRGCAELEDLHVYKAIHKYPSSYELSQLLKVFGPQIVFLDATSPEEALELTRQIRSFNSTAGIIGFAQQCDKKWLVDATEAGVNDFLAAPFTPEGLAEAVIRALRVQESEAADNVVAFLPGKAGSGSTTVALNTAGFLAHDHKQRVLLIETDIHSGPLSVLLKLNPEYSIIDALENCQWLKDEVWSKLVSQAHGLDLLLAPGPTKVARLGESNCRRLLAFVRPRYDTIIVDLPEVINDATQAIVTQASRVYVVCTSDPPSLALARRRIQELQTKGVWASRLKIVLNRFTDKDPKVAQIEQVLEREVSVVVPNDYPHVRQAIQNGALVSGSSKLGKAFSSFAQVLVNRGLPDSRPAEPSGFLGIFQRRAPQHS
jgi:pilus assembly protein CpaE